MGKKKANTKPGVIRNKRATFDYEILDTFTAGIVLYGTEIKSIRGGKASLVDTFCLVSNGEVWVKNMYIAEYFFGSYNNHVPKRDRKLLLNKREIRELEAASKDVGLTIIPLKLFINDRGLAKMEIGIAKGKKEYDKRAAIKEREEKRIARDAKKIDY
ncbi:MAG: SsrA-binding protein SmpB [Porphyromonas sp.]|nr:SsrA-binding protein SmpB [Bacteroidales bacterium]MDD7558991.1 SsrA-binding protein SmpB [Bacteroidales bacterium]MDY3100729.1 SsrA-binding protein SmpB [Porphyromonas sp.]